MNKMTRIVLGAFLAMVLTGEIGNDAFASPPARAIEVTAVQTDPGGISWGDADRGFVVGLRLEKTVYAAGEPIAAVVATKNVGGSVVRIANVPLENYSYDFRAADGAQVTKSGELLGSEFSGRDPFATTLEPGQAVVSTVDFAHLRALPPGKYSVRVSRSIYAANPPGQPFDMNRAISLAKASSPLFTFEVR